MDGRPCLVLFGPVLCRIVPHHGLAINRCTTEKIQRKASSVNESNQCALSTLTDDERYTAVGLVVRIILSPSL
jgi:hypothetical protein